MRSSKFFIFDLKNNSHLNIRQQIEQHPNFKVTDFPLLTISRDLKPATLGNTRLTICSKTSSDLRFFYKLMTCLETEAATLSMTETLKSLGILCIETPNYEIFENKHIIFCSDNPIRCKAAVKLGLTVITMPENAFQLVELTISQSEESHARELRVTRSLTN